MRAAWRPLIFLIGALLLASGVFFDGPVAQAPTTQTIALTGARLIDGTGRPPVEQATLIIGNGRIEAVGTAAAVTVPAGATRIDLSGKTVIPGLINAHAHVNADAAFYVGPGRTAAGQRSYSTSSSAWQGIFSAMTDKQLASICAAMLKDIDGG